MAAPEPVRPCSSKPSPGSPAPIPAASCLTTPSSSTLPPTFNSRLAAAHGDTSIDALKTVAACARPDPGRIRLADAILFDAASHVQLPPRRRQGGYVSQSDSLFPYMTVRQNLVFAARRWPRLERHRRVAEMLDRFQLSAASSTRPHGLDATGKLRCSIARALVAEPRLLLLDECGAGESLLRQIREVTQAPILFATANLDL